VTDDHIRVTGTAKRSLAPSGVMWRVDATEYDEDPRGKAERLASAAGRRLGRVRSAETEPDDRHVFEAAQRMSGPDVTPREQTVTASVTVVFALED
jgi:uncharacterized protein YggE